MNLRVQMFGLAKAALKEMNGLTMECVQSPGCRPGAWGAKPLVPLSDSHLSSRPWCQKSLNEPMSSRWTSGMQAGREGCIRQTGCCKTG